jgi:hypothetical protein
MGMSRIRRLMAMGVIGGAAAATYKQTLLGGLTGIVAYLPLTPDLWAEGASGVQDVSGNGRHGTNNGATPNAADGLTASMGRAPSFDETSDYIALGFATWTNHTRGTIAAWIKLPADSWTDGKHHAVWYFRRDSGGTQLLSCAKPSTSNRIAIEWYAGGTGATRNIDGLSFTDWTHICFTWDEALDESAIYINGIMQGVPLANAGTSAATAYTTNLLGSHNAGTLAWKGNIHHFIVLDHALSENDLLLLMIPLWGVRTTLPYDGETEGWFVAP